MPSLTHTSEVQLSVLDEDLTRPLLQPGFWPPGSPVVATRAESVDANSRAMLTMSFDVAEMSFATYLRARLVDGLPLIALPVFTGRRFTQPLMGMGPSATMRGPADLAGSRIAVPQFGMTSSVWHRYVLRTYYGVDHTDIEWITTAPERLAAAASDASVTRIDDGRSPIDLVRDGVADAALMPRPPVGLTPFFDDPVGEQQRYFAATRILPVMHLVVLTEELVRARPDIARILLDAFAAARASVLPGPGLPALPDSVIGNMFANDPWAHGLATALPAVSALIAQAVHERVIPTAVAPAELFLKGTP